MNINLSVQLFFLVSLLMLVLQHLNLRELCVTLKHLFEKYHPTCKNCRCMFLCVLFSAFLANFTRYFSLHCYMTACI